MSELQSGVYLIKSKNTGRYIGRFPVEDLSLLPKGIFALPEGLPPPHWILESKGDDEFVFKTQGVPVRQHQGHAQALLIEEMGETSENWSLDKLPGDTFAVRRKSTGDAWFTNSDNETGRGYEILVNKDFGPNQEFEFVRVDRD